MKIDWKAKLTSRKFWMAVASFVTLSLTAAGMSDNTVAQASAIIMAGASVIAYIVGEGLTDAARSNSNATTETKEEENK